MSLRISSAATLILTLAACGGEVAPPPAGETIACAIGAQADFADACTLETVAGGSQIIIHHPDGGFRRFNTDPAAGTLVPVDGAEPLVIEESGDALQVAIGPDRYRIPRPAPQSPPTPALTP